jgi:hypothetical protein
MSSIRDLLSVFAAYRSATGLAQATVSTRFLGRGSRLGELMAGGDMGSLRIDRTLADISRQWPAEAAWPEGVERPDPPPLPQREREAEASR